MDRKREREREIFKESEQWLATQWIHPRYTVSLSLTLCVGRSFHSYECALVYKALKLSIMYNIKSSQHTDVLGFYFFIFFLFFLLIYYKGDRKRCPQSNFK